MNDSRENINLDQGSKYRTIFNRRGHSYNDAIRLAPLAREEERAILIDLLAPEPQERICDIPAGGGYVAEGLRNLFASVPDVVCVEPSIQFQTAIRRNWPTIVSSMTRVSLPSRSMDGVGSLAGVHHMDVDQRAKFYSEMYRVLKPGKKFVLGDVREGTDVARFLNGTVHQLSSTGHEGMFLRKENLVSALDSAGFMDVKGKFRRFKWNFPDRRTMANFCKKLFDLQGTDLLQIESEINDVLSVSRTEAGVMMNWSLLYATGIKPSDLSCSS